MEDMGGTLLESSGSLLLLAKEGIRLESMTGIAVQGVSDIMALYGAGTSSLCVNGSVDMMGALTGLGGSTYRNYAPYADAPEEGEFDWGGFTRNLVMGLAVGAACIAMSLLLPGIGTIAAGALMGAGIGAVSASVAGAIGDYSSGNVRSAEEAIRDVAVSMVSGALTGAITGGLGAKLASAFPKAAEAVGKIPLADWAKVGLFNTGDGILGRMVYAVADGNMSVEEKFAYAFSPEYMAMDFLGGVAMYGMSKVLSKIREKLPWNKISNESGRYSLPQGISQEQFSNASKRLRDRVGDISGDIVVQGSRAKGTAKPTSDIDIALRVSGDKFDSLINQYFKTPNPGSAKERTMLHAIETGKIQAGEAKLSGLRKELQEIFGMEVDISIIKQGGAFDNPPFIPFE